MSDVTNLLQDHVELKLLVFPAVEIVLSVLLQHFAFQPIDRQIEWRLTLTVNHLLSLPYGHANMSDALYQQSPYVEGTESPKHPLLVTALASEQ